MMTKEELIAFEQRIAGLWEAGDLPFLLHLSGGNEDELLQLFTNIRPGDWVFSSHRNHYHYLLHKSAAAGRVVAERTLEDLIRAGKSMFVFDREINFLSSSILAGTCGIAAGVAWALQEQMRATTGHNYRVSPDAAAPRVWCFLGDGAEDEGHFYEAVMLVAGLSLPCAFVIEDNNRSVDTNIADRRGPCQPTVDLGGGQFTAFAWPTCVQRYHYTPTYPHAGNGTKKQIVFKPEAIARHLKQQVA